MAWAKLDDGYPDHPKVDALSDAAFRIHVRAICYSARMLTDGFVPESTAKRWGKAPRFQELLVAGLMEPTDGGWLVHDYLEYNPSREQVLAEREKAAARQSRFRNGVTNETTNGVTNASPSPPLPSRPQKNQERTLDPDQRSSLVTKYRQYANDERVNEQIDLALSHENARKYKRLELFVGNWLRREFVNNTRPQRGRPAFNNNPETRSHGVYESVVKRG